MSLEAILVNARLKLSAKRFERATMNPAKVQKEKLLSIIKKNKNTEYGKKYGFSSISSVADYQKHVPVIKYEDIMDDVERQLAGEKNILTAETPILFNKTSGTTGKPKYIPVTPTCKNHEHREASMALLYYLALENPCIHNGWILSLVSPAVEDYTKSGIPIGSTTGTIYRDMPEIVRKNYVVPYEVFEIKDYQAKYYAIMRLSMEQDVLAVCSANPSSILKICEKGNEFSEEIIRDIRDGTLSKNFELEPEIRNKLEKQLKPNLQRSRLLEKMKSERKGVLKPADYWPSLAMIGCWKAGTVSHYLEKFPQWFNMNGDGKLKIWDWGYLSSEARCTISVTDKERASVLAVSNNFYEFVDADEVTANPDESSAWTFLTAEQVQDKKEYYIFITTTGGLYRYDINDLVRVEGYYNKTPKIVFLRKGQGMTNITGEKISVNQVIEAVQHATREVGFADSYFMVEADIERSGYVLRLESAANIGDEKGRAFILSFDDYLKENNIEYKGKRDSMRLAVPMLHVMRQGWYDQHQRHLTESGKKTFQMKTQILRLVESQPKEISADVRQVIEI